MDPSSASAGALRPLRGRLTVVRAMAVSLVLITGLVVTALGLWPGGGVDDHALVGTGEAPPRIVFLNTDRDGGASTTVRERPEPALPPVIEMAGLGSVLSRPSTATPVSSPTRASTPAPAPSSPSPTTTPNAPTASPPTTAAPTTTAPPTTAAPTTTQAPPAGATRNGGAESQFLAAINQSRAAEGLGALSGSSCVANNVAAPWARHMADTGTLAHNPSFAGQTSQCFNWARVGENVGRGRSVSAIHNAFMASPTHRNNIVGDYSHVGIAVYQTSSGEMWVAVNFAKV